jgi:hypothetical protein
MLLLVSATQAVQNRAETPPRQNIGAIVLVDSTSPSYRDFVEYIQLYLDHYDLPYTIWDLASRELTPGLADASLVIVGHNLTAVENGRLNSEKMKLLDSCVENGLGMVSFDGAAESLIARHVSTWMRASVCKSSRAPQGQSITIFTNRHYIAQRKAAGEKIPFRGQFPLVDYGGVSSPFETVAAVGSVPLITAGTRGKGRVVVFSSYAWLNPDHLGFFAGMDDLVWRSLVWAARKPFVMQGMPPLVSLRVDDCVGGKNGDWAYVEPINRVGIVPHLTFMLDDITEASGRRMAELANAKKIEVSVHARKLGLDGFFWWDHNNNRAFDDLTMQKNFEDAVRFFAKYGLHHARSINIHFEEMGENAKQYMRKLGIEFVVSWTNFGMPAYRQDLFAAAPYLKYRPAGYWRPRPSSGSSGQFIYNGRAVMDWLDQNHWFFDSYVDPIDIKHDWLRKCALPPYTDTFEDAGMILDGTAMLKRELDSMFPAYYFAHELNIDRYDVEKFGKLLREVWGNLAPYHPEPASYDEINRYARAQFTSRLERASYDRDRNLIIVRLTGSSDIPTRIWVYTGEGDVISERMERIPEFSGAVEVRISAPRQNNSN